MPTNRKFPGTVGIKRVIAAASRAGIEIGSIEIHPNKITIHPRNPADEQAETLVEIERRGGDRSRPTGAWRIRCSTHEIKEIASRWCKQSQNIGHFAVNQN